RTGFSGPAETVSLTSVAFSPDGRTLAVSGTDGLIRLWQPELGQAVGRLEGPAGAMALAFSPDGRTLAAGGTGGNPRLLDAAALDEIRQDRVPTAPANAAEDLTVETDRLRVEARTNLATFLKREGDPGGEKEMLTKAVTELDESIVRSPNLRSLQFEQAELL